VFPTNVVVTFVPPAKVIFVPDATVVGPPVPPCIDQVYVPGIVDIGDQVLSPLKYTVSLGVPVALNSARKLITFVPTGFKLDKFIKVPLDMFNCFNPTQPFPS
jgi:hypothetical protein